MDTTVYVVMSYDNVVAVFSSEEAARLYSNTQMGGWYDAVPYNPSKELQTRMKETYS